jgi:hypothetical protein
MGDTISPATAETEITRRTILAADDSTVILDALDSLFAPLYRTIHASNGAAALKLARALRPDLIITDSTPVILWSVIYRPHQIKALVNGCDPFVALDKPGDLDVLLSTVDDLVDSAGRIRPK